MCKDLPDADWVDFQEDMFSVNQLLGEIRPDSAASNGKAIWMPSTHREWAVQLPLPISLWMNGVDQEWTTYVVVRVERKGKGEGTAFSYGMYDTEQHKGMRNGTTIALLHIKDDSYHVYKVATTGLSVCATFGWRRPETRTTWRAFGWTAFSWCGVTRNRKMTPSRPL